MKNTVFRACQLLKQAKAVDKALDFGGKLRGPLATAGRFLGDLYGDYRDYRKYKASSSSNPTAVQYWDHRKPVKVTQPGARLYYDPATDPKYYRTLRDLAWNRSKALQSRLHDAADDLAYAHRQEPYVFDEDELPTRKLRSVDRAAKAAANAEETWLWGNHRLGAELERRMSDE